MRASPAQPCHAEMAGQLETQPAITPALSYAWHSVSAMPDDVSMVPCTNAYLAARWGSCRAAMTACLRLWQRKTAHAQVFLLLHPYTACCRAELCYLKQHASRRLHIDGPRSCRMPGGLSATFIQAAAQRTSSVEDFLKPATTCCTTTPVSFTSLYCMADVPAAARSISQKLITIACTKVPTTVETTHLTPGSAHVLEVLCNSRVLAHLPAACDEA